MRSFAVDFAGAGRELHTQRSAPDARRPVRARRRQARRHQTTPTSCSTTDDSPTRTCAREVIRSSRLCRSVSATWTPRCTCCSRPSASSPPSRCPASPPTRSSAATASSTTRGPADATRFPWLVRSAIVRHDARASSHRDLAGPSTCSLRSSDRYDEAVAESRAPRRRDDFESSHAA